MLLQHVWGRRQVWELFLGGAEGQATDIEIAANEILRIRQVLNGILSKTTGKSLSQIEKDTDRNYFMSAQEAQEYGIVDKVLESRKDSGKSK